MVLNSSLSAIEGVRGLFEIPDDVVYLNCANMAPQLCAVTKDSPTGGPPLVTGLL